ncbi:MAG: hypothetical protein ACJ75Z_04590 [Solirubrobacterales bacterium]
MAVGLAVGAWLVLVIRQVADGGFYSDDWGIQWDWRHFGYSEAVSRQFDILGSKPLLAVVLPAPYELFGAAPAGHHILAAALVLASAMAFYFVLRGLRFQARDALPIALLALLFPWASAVRFWPAGSLNNIAVLLLFGGFLIALRGLRVPGRRGLLIHLVAAACYAASVLTYEVTTVVALMLWLAYLWLYGWRPAWPRALIDIAAVSGAAVYSAENTVKTISSLSDQLGHIGSILGDGADLIAASLLPVSVPAEFPIELTIAVLGLAVAVLVATALRGRAIRDDAASGKARRWVAVAGVALAALALCWAIYLPQAFYTPTFRGLEDRVNVLALYPAAVLVWAVLRSVGSLLPRWGYPIAVAGSIAIITGYWVNDLRQQNDWIDSAKSQESVLSAIERASPPDGSLVLAFDYPAQVAPRLPTLNASWDIYPAAQLHTDRAIETYPVFKGTRLACTPKGVRMDYVATPLYKTIPLRAWGTPRLQRYPEVVFVGVEGGRHAVIRSPDDCADALRQFMPGPWIR